MIQIVCADCGHDLDVNVSQLGSLIKIEVKPGCNCGEPGSNCHLDCDAIGDLQDELKINKKKLEEKEL